MNPFEGLIWYVAFLLSTAAHEAAHAGAAWFGGDPTARRAGQMSLNPLPHIRREPFGMLILPLLAISQGWCAGWASTPYDPAWEQRFPRRAAWMAAAGPAMNLLLALAAFLLLRAGLVSGVFEIPLRVGYSQLVSATPVWLDAAGRALSILLTLNLLLCILNLMPVPPLDGATAITLLFPESLAGRLRAVLRNPRLGMLAFLIVFLFFGRLFRPVFQLVVAHLWNR